MVVYGVAAGAVAYAGGVEEGGGPSTADGQEDEEGECAGGLGLGAGGGVCDEHGIPRLELYDRGYTSIGCEPCTAIPAAGADPRSGRWGGKKLECGIHTFREKQ